MFKLAITYTVQPGDTLFRIAQRFSTTVQAIVQANNIADPNRISPGMVLTIPVEERIYIVQPGDTLFAIANRFGVSVQDIVRANNIADPNRISPGQRLVIPTPGAPSPPPADGFREYIVQPGDTLFSIANRFGVTVQDIVRANNIADPNRIFPGQRLVIPTPGVPIPPPDERFREYTVQPGDTLWSIARRFGVTVNELVQINQITDPNLIRVGQTLLIPQVTPPPQAIYRGNTQKRMVSFTFDATYGDNQTNQLLDIMNRYGFRSTFFLSGIWLENYPALARAIASAGHEIGNHTYNHPHLGELSDAEIRNQILRTDSIIRNVTGQTARYFRPPFGEFNDRILQIASELGHQTIMWTIDSLDWQNPGVNVIVRRVLDNAANGAIVLMHQAAPETPLALPQILDALIQRGFTFGTVTEVLDP